MAEPVSEFCSGDSDFSLPWHVWMEAVSQPVIDRQVRSLYVQLDRAVAQQPWVCQTRGKCCQFQTFGHLLYVTGLEIAWFLSQYRGCGRGRLLTVDLQGSCPLQEQGLCSVHAIRPMGCRIFFCQAGTDQDQHVMYETFLEKLRGLHDEHDLPWRYIEWRHGLAEAQQYVASHGLTGT